ncbi:Flavin mononucleotide phosphatase YigB [Pseudovibrio axinellae]|uniref:Flavin mononucleotide phosphatase YigB n=1 Tax=Pseudovibrio axinellae TaxID=989403 RepID=A0A166AVA1_9HYPH|nr:HAD family hydrolase [Pseudovibrio axinellae]KZL21596.1 Flavin mononucleotide phosphatase YigB [Pseudovibrio axinellae]SER11033.1 putative hydrolase of the HAD superfamily [Pseudovibrio axinellae]
MPRNLLISFDADQTLFDFERILEEALITTASFLSHYSEKPITPRYLQKIRDSIVDDMPAKTIGLLEIRRASFEQALNPLSNARELSEQALVIFKKVRFGEPYFYPFVKETLATLKRQNKTALITNGNSCPKSAGIAHLFDFVVMAEEYPYSKPDPRLFKVMLSMAGLSADNLIHVGDSLEDDIAGANNVGATSVWFNPLNYYNGSPVLPDHSIACMRELPSLVAGYASR